MWENESLQFNIVNVPFCFCFELDGLYISLEFILESHINVTYLKSMITLLGNLIFLLCKWYSWIFVLKYNSFFLACFWCLFCFYAFRWASDVCHILNRVSGDFYNTRENIFGRLFTVYLSHMYIVLLNALFYFGCMINLVDICELLTDIPQGCFAGIREMIWLLQCQCTDAICFWRMWVDVFTYKR